MEFITYFLSAVFGLLSTAGFFVETIAKNTIRSRFERVEQLQVRVDNLPSYQLVQGKLERVRIAGRGLWLIPEARIAALELETDPVDVNIQQLRQRGQLPTAALRQPLQAAVRLVLNEADINQALETPRIKALLQNMVNRYAGAFLNQGSERYTFVNPRVEFLANNRLRFQLDLQQEGEKQTDVPNMKKLPIRIESGIAFVSGRRLQLIEPTASIDQNEIPSFLLGPLSQGLTEQFDLGQLEQSGITARLLQLKINPEQLEIAAFVRVSPTPSPQKHKN